MRKISPVTVIISIVLVSLTLYLINKNNSQMLPEAPITKMTQENAKQITEKPSSDGTMKLTQVTQKEADGRNIFSFTVTDQKTNISKSVYETIEDQTTSFMIPDNSWSNNNKQFFIEKITSDDVKYLVFKADGSLYPQEQKFLDIGSYWSKTKNTQKISNVTGWASEDLLIVYTTKIDGTKGPSFWFVISTQKFLQLIDRP